jgi:hypothetical protein
MDPYMFRDALLKLLFGRNSALREVDRGLEGILELLYGESRRLY